MMCHFVPAEEITGNKDNCFFKIFGGIDSNIDIFLKALTRANGDGRVEKKKNYEITNAPGYQHITYQISEKQVNKILNAVDDDISEQEDGRPLRFCFSGSDAKGSSGNNCITWAKGKLKIIGIDCSTWLTSSYNKKCFTYPDKEVKKIASIKNSFKKY